MSQTWTVELFVYLSTALSALMLLPRCVNWRLRLIVGTIGLQSLAQSVTQLKLNHPFWQSRLGSLAGNLELIGGALALTAVYLLRRENVARKGTDVRLRLSEAMEGLPVLARAVQSESGVRSAPVLNGNGSSMRSEELETHSPQPRKLRRTRRYPVSIAAQITELNGEKQMLQCEVADISQGGALLCMPKFVPLGGLVKIEFQYRMYLGEVCRCQEFGGNFLVGVRFEHMVDLNELSRILREVGFEAKEAGAKPQDPRVSAAS